MLNELPDVDVVVVPVGGGGLISGVAYALKTLKPSVKIFTESNYNWGFIYHDSRIFL